MRIARLAASALCLVVSLLGLTAHGQGRPDPEAAIAAQRLAMMDLLFMDGMWRGTAWSASPTGEKHTLMQTERVGTFLGSTIRVVEGRGYAADGSVAFNALGVISFDPAKKAYSMRSYAMGHSGDFALAPTADGFTWEIPAGPMTIRYTATIKDGKWHEIGERIVPGKEPVRIFEMNLERIGDSDWPNCEPVPIE
ncbi:MAG: DUF1579 domain-containing protein [Thermoanaerobaculia bacterium]